MSIELGMSRSSTPAPESEEWRQLYFALEEYASLAPGWDGYDSPAPTNQARANAKEFLDVLSTASLTPARLRPSVVGGLGVTFRSEQRKAYVEFHNDGPVHVLFSDGVTDPQTKQVANGRVSYLALATEIREYLGD